MFKIIPGNISCLLNKTIPLILSSLMTFCVILYTKTHVTVVEKPCSDIAEDYIRIICNRDKFKQNSKKQVSSLKSDSETEGDAVKKELIDVASVTSLERNMVLFTVANEAYLPFVYSWLCNTKTMNIHQSVLIATTDLQTKKKLNLYWPEIHVVSMDIGTLRGNQTYSKVGYTKLIIKRTEMVLTLLMANINVFIFEVDCVWLSNPILSIPFKDHHDIIVNPVSGSNGKLFAGGFIWLRSTCRTKIVWHKVADLMMHLRERIEPLQENEFINTFEYENEQVFLAELLQDGYGNASIKRLPLEMFADGKWYNLNDEDRYQTRPVIINNNLIIGNEAKMKRAKEWNHWFVLDDLTCDMDLVNRIIN